MSIPFVYESEIFARCFVSSLVFNDFLHGLGIRVNISWDICGFVHPPPASLHLTKNPLRLKTSARLNNPSSPLLLLFPSHPPPSLSLFTLSPDRDHPTHTPTCTPSPSPHSDWLRDWLLQCHVTTASSPHRRWFWLPAQSSDPHSRAFLFRLGRVWSVIFL